MKTPMALALCFLAGAALSGEPKPVEHGKLLYFEGESSSHAASRMAAEKDAIKSAATRAGEWLEQKGLGKKWDIARGVESASVRETEVSAYHLGKVRIENIYQERREGPDGQDAWSARVKISIMMK
jgi:hypothetical protein